MSRDDPWGPHLNRLGGQAHNGYNQYIQQHAAAPFGSESSTPAAAAAAAARRRRRAAGWDVASVMACSMLLILGVALAVLSGSKLWGSTAIKGQMVGGLCCLLGLLGWLAAGLPLPCASGLDLISSSRPARAAGQSFLAGLQACLGLPLRTALLVGLLTAALGTLGLMDQASSDTTSQCLLAEVSARVNHLEAKVTRLRHDEMLTQLFFRLNEMDDLLTATAEGSTAHAELRSQMFSLQAKDREVIRERVDRLQRHAAALLQDMRAQLAAAKLQAEQAQVPGLEQDKKRREEELWLLEKRAEAVQSVMHYMEARSHDSHSELSYEEYDIILHALLDGSNPEGHVPGSALDSMAAIPVPRRQAPQEGAAAAHPAADGAAADAGQQQVAVAAPVAVLREALVRDKADAEALKAAFQRRAAGGSAYEEAAESDPRLHVSKHVRDKREAARKEFEARFFSVYQEGAGHLHPDNFRHTLQGALDALPQHCLMGEQAVRWLHWLCFGLAAAQTLVAYTNITVLMRKALVDKDA